jgi:CRP/FNR family transcriptional regulator
MVSLNRDDLLALLRREPALSLCIMGGMTLRLRKLVGIIEQISFEDITHRLWKFLLESSTKTGSQNFPRIFHPLPTRDFIANAIGTVREVVSRRLSHLAEAGYLKIEKRRLTLLKSLDD